jgi:hypothetical protein
MIPTEKDIEKQQEKLAGLLKLLDKDGKSQKSAMVAMVRGAVRKSWMKSPTKLAYLHSKIQPDLDDTNRRKWKVTCECCGGSFKMDEIEIDHKHGNHSFLTPEDFLNYFEKILMVGFDDLSALCKECHATKTLSEKLGIGLKDAAAHKQAIAIIKKKQDKEWLISNGITPAGNEKARRTQIVDFLYKAV